MQKTFKKTALGLILCLVMLLCAGVALTACQPAQQEEVTYTVVYDTQGGGAVKDGTYTPGVNFNLPTPSIGTDPEMYGYSFIGWFYDAACTQPVDRTNIDTSKAVDGVLTFYAGWSNVHKIYFDTKTDQIIDPLEYEYGATVSVNDLPTPNDRVVGSAVCEFICWVQANTDQSVTVDFRMDAVDMYFYALYDTGVNSKYELTEDGYYAKSFGANTELTSVGSFEDGTVLSVDMTFPADPSDYGDDCGPVFGFSDYIESSDSFGDGSTGYMYLFISAAANQSYNTNKGALDVWGTWTDADGNEQGPGRLYYMGMNTDLAGTPYQQKFAAYLTSGESETFTYTVRRSGNCFYIGVDGIEYCCVELGGARKPSSATENLTGTISENLTGTRVGLRSKSTNVYYNNITITPAEEVSVTFDAVNGRMDGEQIVTETYSYNAAIGTLPTPVYEGFEFAGWYYTDYLTGETKQLTAETVLDDSFWQLTVTARWRREGAQPYTVSFDTGVDGYTVADVEGWYEGNPLAAPELSRTFWTFSEEWYYDEECTRPVDLNAVDPTQTGAGGTQAFTLYAKAEEHDFTGEGWTETDGTYTGSTDTLVNGFEAKAGQTLEIDITLPAYSSSYGVSGILFGATGLGANDSYYWLRIVGSSDSNEGARGAIQLYKDGAFAGADYSKRITVAPLAGSSYAEAYEAHKTSGETLTVTLGVIIEADKIHCMVDGTIVFTYETQVEGAYIGFKPASGTTMTYSDIRITNNGADITFDAGEGDLPEGAQETIRLATGTALGTLPTPTRSGYDFVAWLYNGTAVTQDTTFDATVRTVTLTAQWVEQGAQVTITFDPGDDGATVSEPSRTIAAGAAIGELPVPTREGYRFLGWYDGDTLVTATTVAIENMTLVAKWESASGWDGTTAATAYANGSGTQEDPYQISSGAELKYFADTINGGTTYEGVYFTLTQDINLNSHAWTPAGTSKTIRFAGNLDGDGHTISNLTSKLFGYAGGAAISDLKLEVAISTTVTNTAGLIGTVQGGAVTIANSEVRGTVASTQSLVGGFVGWVDAALTMTNCTNYANITCTVASGFAFAGGIIGSHNSGVLLLTNCKNYGTVTAATGTMVGGIVGIVRTASATGSLITECYNFADVTGASQVGGIAGCLRLAATNCYNSTEATITGSAEARPIAGQVNNGGSYTNCGTCDANGENKTPLPDQSS